MSKPAPPPRAAGALVRLLGELPREEGRRLKARAYWAARQQKRRQKRAPAEERASCPITLMPLPQLREPCVASDGHVYERLALEQWALRSATSPLTRQPLEYGVPLSAAARGQLSMSTAKGALGLPLTVGENPKNAWK